MENEEQGKKSKKSSKSQLYHEDEKIVKKTKKRMQRDDSPGDSEVDDKSFNGSKPNLPEWLEMTDSEDEFQKPVEKPKKKKRRMEVEEPEVKLEYDDGYDGIYGCDDNEESQVKLENSPKKKKKKKKKKQEVDESMFELKDEPIFPKTSKKQQKKQKIPSEIQENGDMTDEDQFPLQETAKKVGKKPLEDAEQATDKKKPTTPTKSPKKLTTVHEDLLSDTEEFEEPTKEPSPKKSTTNSTKTKPPTKAALAKQAAQQNSNDPLQTPKKPVKKITKIPSAEQVTLGEEYKRKKVEEKSCNNCSESVKIKIKTKVRDMGTQTADSAVLNGLKTRGRPRALPRLKTENPVSVEDRIVIPKQPDGDEELLNAMGKVPRLTKEQISKLKTMEISMKHPVLPQHDVENSAGCRPLTTEEKQAFESFANLKTGVWSMEEDNKICKNWKKFCKRHDWDPQISHPFVGFRHRGAYYIPKFEERKKFVQFLAHGLPNRSLYSVFTRFKNLFSTHKQDRYTPLEDQILMNKIENNPDLDKNSYLSDLANELNRTRQSIWRRYRLLKKRIEDVG